MRRLLRSILAATDLGSGSDAIVHSAALLAARTGAELHLLHSLELPWEMGEHGRSEVKRGPWTLLGSTVERVLRASPAPVLVARGAPPQRPPRHLLVAVDGSDPSLRGGSGCTSRCAGRGWTRRRSPCTSWRAGRLRRSWRWRSGLAPI